MEERLFREQEEKAVRELIITGESCKGDISEI